MSLGRVKCIPFHVSTEWVLLSITVFVECLRLFFFPRYFDVKAAVSLLLPSTFLSSRDVLVLFGTLLCVVFRVLMFLEHEKLSALFFLALVPNSIFRE